MLDSTPGEGPERVGQPQGRSRHLQHSPLARWAKQEIACLPILIRESPSVMATTSRVVTPCGYISKADSSTSLVKEYYAFGASILKRSKTLAKKVPSLSRGTLSSSFYPTSVIRPRM